MRIKTLLVGLFVLTILNVVAILPVYAQDDLASETTTSDSSDSSGGETDLKVIASRCVQAQSKIRAIQQQATDAGNKRIKLYANFDGRLWVAIGKLKLAGKDTAELEKSRADLGEKAAKFAELNQAYVQTLGQLSQSGCRDDPATFQANLTSAKAQLAELRTHNTETRTLVNNDIKEAISQHTSDDGSSEDTSEVEE